MLRDPSAHFAHRGWALGWGMGCTLGVKLAWPDRPVVALLGAQVALGAATAYLAVRDPAHAVTPGYHAKALAWEDQLKRQSASDALGWKAGAE